MTIEFTDRATEDFDYWLEAEPEKATRIRDLIADCVRDPFKGLGKPEPLKYQLGGGWSRRIDDEHRLVYRVSGSGATKKLTILQCRYHY
jgi:toxin YoeB